MYVIDANTLIIIFKYYYKNRFPSFWSNFNNYIKESKIISVREVFNEINNHSSDALTEWSKKNRTIFEDTDEEEIAFITEIFSNQHFQNLLSKKSIIAGKPVADPFIIAKAKCKNKIVITQELLKPNAAKIPNVCEYFGVAYLNLESFMEKENWIF